MLDLIFKNDEIAYRNQHFPEFIKIKDYIKRDIEAVSSYYISKNFNSRNDDLFVQIIKHLDIDLDIDNSELRSHVEDRVKRIVRLFKIFSFFNFGEIHEDLWYKNSDSFILLEDNAYDYDENQNHKEIKPLRMLKTNFIDYNFNIPSRNINAEDIEILYSINLYSLVYKYVTWGRERRKLELSTNPVYFVEGPLKVSVLTDIADNSIVNHYLDNDLKIVINKKETPIALTNQFNNMEKVVRKYRNKHDKVKEMIPFFLYNIELVGQDNALEFFKIHKTYLNMATKGFIFYSRLSLFNDLLELGGRNLINRNMVYMNQIKLELRYIETSRLSSKFPIMQELLFNLEIEKFKVFYDGGK